MKAQTVIDRLLAQVPILGQRVYHVRRINEIEAPADGTPVAYVVTRPPQYQENDGVGALVNQPKRRRFAVILQGQAPLDSTEPLVDAVDEIDAALIGWSPQPEIQVTADGAEESKAEGSLLTWILNYSWQDYERHVR